MIPEIEDPNVELMTYYVIWQSAMDTPAKQTALQNLEKGMIATLQNQPMMNPAMQ
jgi:hypothetical protein